jgi:hypothetical protein
LKIPKSLLVLAAAAAVAGVLYKPLKLAAQKEPEAGDGNLPLQQIRCAELIEDGVIFNGSYTLKFGDTYNAMRAILGSGTGIDEGSRVTGYKFSELGLVIDYNTEDSTLSGFLITSNYNDAYYRFTNTEPVMIVYKETAFLIGVPVDSREPTAESFENRLPQALDRNGEPIRLLEGRAFAVGRQSLENRGYFRVAVSYFKPAL